MAELPASETADLGQGHPEGFTPARGLVGRRRHGLKESHRVALLAQRPFDFLQFGDIRHHGETAAERPIRAEQGLGCHEGGDEAAVLALPGQLVHRPGTFAAVGKVFVEDTPIGFVKEFSDRTADHFRDRVAEHLAEALVGISEPGIVVDHRQAVVHGLDQGSVAFFAFLKFASALLDPDFQFVAC
ncbi:MAG: hypothetical protein H7841_16360, partial [Magnetospirillum sp. WYHS-4]